MTSSETQEKGRLAEENNQEAFASPDEVRLDSKSFDVKATKEQIAKLHDIIRKANAVLEELSPNLYFSEDEEVGISAQPVQKLARKVLDAELKKKREELTVDFEIYAALGQQLIEHSKKSEALGGN